MNEKKKCVGPCGLEKKLEEFGKSNKALDGHRGRCKVCTNAAEKTRYEVKVGKTPAPPPPDAALAQQNRAKLDAIGAEAFRVASVMVNNGTVWLRDVDVRPHPILPDVLVAYHPTEGFVIGPVEGQRAADDELDPGAVEYQVRTGRFPAAMTMIEVIESYPAAKPKPEELEPVQEHRMRRELRESQAKVKALVSQLSDARAMRDIAREAAEASDAVEPIRPRERKSGLREATAMVLASDWHIEEEVQPEKVAGRNRYNLEISARRAERFFEATRWAMTWQREVFHVRDLVLWLGGDLITNYLHPDNIESNLLAPVQAIATAESYISSGIDFLLEDDKLERLVVPCNDGNHGRLTEKTRAATRMENSLEWLLYETLRRRYAGNPRVQFQIANGDHLYLDVYGRTVRFTHGDSVNYGGGVGGITIPIYKALARWDTVRKAALTVMGHFHQRTSLADLIINGSLIGYSPYSMRIGARFESPAQDFTMLDPLRFKSVSMPLWVADREDDDQNTTIEEERR